MKQIFKRILKGLIISLFIIWSVILAITSYFAEDIEKNVISKIQQNIEAPLILDKVEFTIYESFPSASIKIILPIINRETSKILKIRLKICFI